MKIFVFDKYAIIVIVLITVLIAGIVPLSYHGIKEASATEKEIPVYSVERNDKKIAVTFNCAWNADDIDIILDELNERNAKCTFFIVGTWAEKYPDALKKIYSQGHEIANHSYNHTLYSKLSKEEIISDINKCDDVTESILGVRTTLVRAPSGDYDNNSVIAVKESNHTLIQWDTDSLDWRGYTKEQMKKRILDRVKSGSIILFHNGTENTAKSIGDILDSLSNEGYSFTTVSDLIYKDNYSINHEGRQFKN